MILLEIPTIGSIENKLFRFSKMHFAFRTFTPITSLIRVLLFMDAAQCVFAVVTSADVENV